MGGLKIRVGLVLGVALPVVGEGRGFGPDVHADGARCRGVREGSVLILVITKVQNEIGVLVGKVSVGGEPAVFVVGAGREAHRQRRKRAGLRRGAGAAGW